MTGAPPVLIVDDHALVAGSLRLALRGRGIEAEALLPEEFLPRLDDPARPGALILLDLDLDQDVDGAALVPRLRRAGWRVLLVTGSTDEVRIAAGIAAGALGRLSKSAPFEELVDAAVRAAQGRMLMSAAERARWESIGATGEERRRDERERWSRLTPRERQIAGRIADGRRTAAIAAEFGVSVATVRTQLRSIRSKLEVRSQLEIAVHARSAGH